MAEGPLALRAGNERFLRMNERGAMLADQLLPTDVASFARVSDLDGRLVLRNGDGRVLVVEDGDPRLLWQAVEGGKSEKKPVEIWRVGEVPAAARNALAMVIRTLVVVELSDQEYKKHRKRKKEEFVRLPAPTLRNLRRTKQRRVLAMEEGYELTAMLDGSPTMEIPRMPMLTHYDHADRGCLMFVVRVQTPVRGRVRYKIPNALDTSTGFLAKVGLELVGRVSVDRTKGRFVLDRPEIVDMDVAIRSLDISNDLVNLARDPIEDFINDELERKRDHIRQQANKTIAKAVDKIEFRNPLLQFLEPSKKP